MDVANFSRSLGSALSVVAHFMLICRASSATDRTVRRSDCIRRWVPGLPKTRNPRITTATTATEAAIAAQTFLFIGILRMKRASLKRPHVIPEDAARNHEHNSDLRYKACRQFTAQEVGQKCDEVTHNHARSD